MNTALMMTILRREFHSYFATPLALIFLIIFLMLSGWLTFYMGGLLDSDYASLKPFFHFHPWLYLVLVPAISMRLWAEERNSGTIELLLTLPIKTWDIVLGKFLAAWLFLGVALLLTFPLWLTVNYLGDPDNGVILSNYIGSFLMAGGFLAIGCCMSACSKSQVIAFVTSLVVCLLFVASGSSMVQDLFKSWMPAALAGSMGELSVLSHFIELTKGVLDLRDVLYFVALIVTWLMATSIVVNLKKAD